MVLLTLILPLYAFQGEPQKISKNCKYFTKDFFTSNTFGKCKLFPRETDGNYYLVDGKTKPGTDYYYCSTARESDDMCGKEGFFFQKK